MIHRLEFIEKVRSQPELQEIPRSVFDRATEELSVAVEELKQQNEALEETQAGLAETNARYYDLFNSAPEAYIITNSSALINETNIAAARMFRLAQDQCTGKPMALFIHEEDRRGFRDRLSRLRETGNFGEWVALIKPRNAVPFEALVSASLTGSSDRVQIRWMIADLTEKIKAKEQLQKAYEEKKKLAEELEARVKLRTAELHEVNRRLQTEIDGRRRVEDDIVRSTFDIQVKLDQKNQLAQNAQKQLDAFLTGFQQVIAKPLAGIEQRLVQAESYPGFKLAGEALQNYRFSCEAFGNAELLFSRIEMLAATFRGTLNKTEIEMNDLLREILGEKTRRRKLRDTKVTFSDMPNCTADADLLKIAVAELIDNAIRFTGEAAEPTIEISGKKGATGFEFSVKDNGIGFERKQKHRLFLPFSSLHKGTRYEGPGLGLAIVHRIVTRHGGQVAADSNERGSRFGIMLDRDVREKVESTSEGVRVSSGHDTRPE